MAESPLKMISQNISTHRHKRKTKEKPVEEEDHFSSEDEERKKKREKKQAMKKMKQDMEEERDRAEKQRLENLLFGNLDTGNELEEAEDSWIIEKPSKNQEIVVQKERKQAWFDEEEMVAKIDIAKVNRLRKLRQTEDEISISGADYVNRLRSHYSQLNPGTNWAELENPSTNFDSDDENFVGRDADILRSNDDLVIKSKSRLLSGMIEISRMKDANAEDPSNAVVQSVSFHKNGQLLMSSGLDKKIKFFQIDGQKNHKVQSVFIQDLPIHQAEFTPDGSKVIASGRRKYFYSFDVVKGKLDRINCLMGRDEKSLETFAISSDLIAFVGNGGYILLVSTLSNQLVGTLKMNGSVRSLIFADNGKQLISAGGDRVIYHWDVGTRKCIHRGVDDGCVRSTALSVSSDNRLLAAGSDAGIVNVYNRDEFVGGVKKPVKTLQNLVTETDNLKFSFDSQLLAISSRMKKNNLRLVHLPTFTVYSNWPTPKCPLQYVHSLDFSPNGGFLAAGNAAGKVLLFKLHHYENA